MIFSRNYVNQDVDPDLLSGFLTALSSFAQEIKGAAIEKMEFMQFQFLYLLENNLKLKFILCIDRDDLIDETKARLELIKKEFVGKYGSYLGEKWNGDVAKFTKFKNFADQHLVIPPKIFLVGERGAGKTTIMDLFPGETILSLDEDLNEIIKKSIKVDGMELINQIDIWKFDFSELIDNSKYYRDLLRVVDILLVITGSSEPAINRTLKSFEKLKTIIEGKNLYIIANKQDQIDIAYKPDVISGYFDNLNTYGLSAIDIEANQRIFEIMAEILAHKYGKN